MNAAGPRLLADARCETPTRGCRRVGARLETLGTGRLRKGLLRATGLTVLLALGTLAAHAATASAAHQEFDTMDDQTQTTEPPSVQSRK